MKTDLKSIIKPLSNILVLLAIIGGTLFTVAYAYGYRFNLEKTGFEKTGVLSIDSRPSFAKILLNGEEIGTTPKTTGSINEGNYSVTLSLEKYHDWKKTVEIKAELSTPYSANLFLQEPEETIEYNSTSSIDKVISSDNRDLIFFSTISTSTNSTNNESSTGIKSSQLYSIYKYQVDRSFLDFSANPTLLVAIPYQTNTQIEIYPSKNSEFLRYDTIIDKKRTTYIIRSEPQSTQPRALDFSPYYKDYSINWSENDKYLVLESKTEILSYNVETNAISVLQKKNGEQKIIWSTDKFGFFYYVSEKELDSEQTLPLTKYFTIIQKKLDGTQENIVIDEIFYQPTNQYISEKYIREGENLIFSNSPYSTLFSGKIAKITPLPDSTSFVIETEFALYWYSLETEKYAIVTNTPSYFIDLSPDNKKFAYVNISSNSLNIYTFNKENNEHFITLGSKRITDLQNDEFTIKPENIKWTRNSSLMTFSIDNSIYFIDIDGDNLLKVFSKPESSVLSSTVIDSSLGNLYDAVIYEKEVSIPVVNGTSTNADSTSTVRIDAPKASTVDTNKSTTEKVKMFEIRKYRIQ